MVSAMLWHRSWLSPEKGAQRPLWYGGRALQSLSGQLDAGVCTYETAVTHLTKSAYAGSLRFALEQVAIRISSEYGHTARGNALYAVWAA